jgi:hypothetical protein
MCLSIVTINTSFKLSTWRMSLAGSIRAPKEFAAEQAEIF